MNTSDDNNYFQYEINTNYLHPYYEGSSTVNNKQTDNSTTRKDTKVKLKSALKPANVYQLFLIITVWLVSVALLSLIIWQLVLPHALLSPIVETFSGRILGSIETRGANRRLAIYQGIPYARPPIGSRRFTRPEPVIPWKGVYKATSKPSPCYQFMLETPSAPTDKNSSLKTLIQTIFSKLFRHSSSSNLITSTADELHQSEDCLYLNLYVPVDENDEPKKRKRHYHNESESKNQNVTRPLKPVLVFIHGGGFISGSINHYDPSILSLEGDIIIATIAYRLGLFGFIYYEEDGSPSIKQGNLGLYDQSLALQWIHTNVQNFGGDPNKIVLFGDFAGSQSVGFHLISNHSQPYFTRAIMLNGSPYNLPLIMSRQRSLNKTRALINETGCNGDDYGDGYEYKEKDSSSPKQLKVSSSSSSINLKEINCLRGLEVNQLITIDRKLSRSMLINYYPVPDESFFPVHPLEIIESGDYGPQKQLMIGYNGHYDSWMKDAGLADFIVNTTSTSDDVTSKMLLNRLANFGPRSIGKHYYEIITQIIMEGHQSVSPLTLAERINSLSLDLAIRCPAYFQITSFLQNETRSVYYFELRASTGYELLNKMFTSLNNYNYSSSAITDLGLIFGYPLMNKKHLTAHSYRYYSQEDVEFSREMMNMWIQFIKHGKPTLNDAWTPCTSEDNLYRYIIKRKGSKLRSGFPDNQCEQYFRILYVIGKSINKS